MVGNLMAILAPKCAAMTKRSPVAIYSGFRVFLAALTPFVLTLVVTLNHYYGPDVVFWDSGYFAYQASFSTTWPMWHPPMYHQGPDGPMEVFRIHVMPIFYLTSAIS